MQLNLPELGLESFLDLQLILVSVLSFAALSLFALLWGLRADLEELRKALRCFARSGNWPSGVTFRDARSDSVYQKTRLLASPRVNDIETREAFDQTLLLGRQLAEASDLQSSVASALLRVLIEQMRPEAQAAAVMLIDQESGDPLLLHALGVPENRIETGLLMCFDQVRGGNSWGYKSAKEGSTFDFNTFGLGLSLFVPLKEGEEVLGSVWIGFSSKAGGLSAQRMNVMRAVADQAAASFAAAKRAELRSEDSERERDYLIALSHDIRSPGNRALYALHDFLEVEGEVLAEEQRTRLSVIEASIREQLELLGDMLRLSSLRNGVLEANPSPVSVYPFLADVVTNYRSLADAKSLVLRTICSPDTFVKVDQKHLRRILANLLSNAIAYTEQGEIEILCEEEKRGIKIAVSDTGVGVSRELRRELFEPFTRQTRDGEGLGLGLAVTKSLVELNGGSLEYNPREGGGSVFTVILPAEPNAEAYLQATLLPEEYAVQCLLVLDDDHAASRSTARALSPLARVTLSAHSVEEARQFLNLHKPDVIVSDFHFLDGTLVDIEDAIEEESLLLVLSGQSSVGLRRKLRARKNTVFFEKPVSASELRGVISGGNKFAKVA